ncbi:hypothetical protein AB3S75_023881, partial [Citrus x aurantiifolia]
KDGEDREINISSAICFLRGKAYEASGNCAQARLWYKAAIIADPLCYEALECLIGNHMLTCEQETSLLSSLEFGFEDGWLSSFYSCLIKKYDKENVVEAKFGEIEKERCDSVHSSPSFSHSLKNNTDLLEGLLFCQPAILDFRNLLFTQCSSLSNCQKVEKPFFCLVHHIYAV